MGKVTVSIDGTTYDIACDDGQETHLSKLGAYVDKRVMELKAAVASKPDGERMLVMASLVIADELSDAYAELDSLRKADRGVSARLEAEESLADGLEALARRIEVIAERLQGD